MDCLNECHTINFINERREAAGGGYVTGGEGSEDPSVSKKQLWTLSNLLPNHLAYARIVKFFGYALRDYLALRGHAVEI